MNRTLLYLIAFLAFCQVQGQTKDSTAIQRVDSTWESLRKNGKDTATIKDSLIKPGTVNLHEEEGISELIERYDESYKLSGFRVQIHSGSERKKAKEMRGEFLKLYPEVKAYEIYQQPNFKIRAGNFRTRLEALKFLDMISEDFPDAFIVPDTLEMHEEEEDKKDEQR